MSERPPGWYQDPASVQRQRWWDGEAWTSETVHGSRPPPSPPASVLRAAAGLPPDAGGPGGLGRPVAAAPGGVRPAGWWRRVAAYLLDGVVLGLVAFLLAFARWRDLLTDLGDYVDAVDAAQRVGAQPPPVSTIQDTVVGDLVVIAVITLVASLLYQVGFLLWCQATPGKLAVGIRVQPADRPGALPVSVVLVRWLATNVPGVLGLLPFVGLVTGVYAFMDLLWPLWDSRNQTLHDKIAGTVVVRTS